MWWWGGRQCATRCYPPAPRCWRPAACWPLNAPACAAPVIMFSPPAGPQLPPSCRLVAPHLRGAGDHVLHVIRVAGAVHVRIVPLVGLVLHCRGAGGPGCIVSGWGTARGGRVVRCLRPAACKHRARVLPASSVPQKPRREARQAAPTRARRRCQRRPPTVCCGDGDAARLLLRSLVDLIESHRLGHAGLSQDLWGS